MSLTLEDLANGGSIVRLRISRPSIEATIPLSIFGVENTRENKKGGKDTGHIVDPEKLAPLVRIELQMRAALIDAGLIIPVVDGGRWIPMERIPQLMTKLDSLSGEFNEALNLFRADFNKSRDAWLNTQQLEVFKARFKDADVIQRSADYLRHRFT